MSRSARAYEPRATVLYRCFSDDGSLLYIGVTEDAHYRLEQHRTTTPWFADVTRVSVENFPTRADALDAEMRAIVAEHPRHNKQRPSARRCLQPVELVAHEAAS